MDLFGAIILDYFHKLLKNNELSSPSKNSLPNFAACSFAHAVGCRWLHVRQKNPRQDRSASHRITSARYAHRSRRYCFQPTPYRRLGRNPRRDELQDRCQTKKRTRPYMGRRHIALLALYHQDVGDERDAVRGAGGRGQSPQSIRVVGPSFDNSPRAASGSSQCDSHRLVPSSGTTHSRWLGQAASICEPVAVALVYL